MLDRQLNIFFFFAVVYVFLLFAEGGDTTRFLIAIGCSFIFVLAAYILKWLTIDGANSAILFGIIALGFGGITGAVILLAFFVSSSLISKDIFDEQGLYKVSFRRNGVQVWSNGFWFALWIIVWFVSEQAVFLIAAISSMAFSTADTWASEIGSERFKARTHMIHTFKKVEPGTDGGVSVPGTIATVFGAFFIAGLFWVMNKNFGFTALFIVAIAGFLGSLADSLIGATVQGKKLNVNIRNIFSNRITYVDNDITNWLSAGTASIIAITTALIFGV